MKVSGVIYWRQLSQNVIYISCKLSALNINKKEEKQNVESHIESLMQNESGWLRTLNARSPWFNIFYGLDDVKCKDIFPPSENLSFNYLKPGIGRVW